ncbi:MAG: hypothetical protein LBS56_06510 [Propionibacteriaceae bacterium]|jgi:hypothetical protein|nr:hypothetical protein [Propionibacteriaceae bacterium]
MPKSGFLTGLLTPCGVLPGVNDDIMTFQITMDDLFRPAPDTPTGRSFPQVESRTVEFKVGFVGSCSRGPQCRACAKVPVAKRHM